MLFIEAAQARSAIRHTYSQAGLDFDSNTDRILRMGIKRDLQARRLRPNVPVPSRREPLRFIRVMRAETGSLTTAIGALLHDGSWTSSGGSFRLAETIGTDMASLCDTALKRNGRLRYLEIGAAWAGMHDPSEADGRSPQNIAGLARRYHERLGGDVVLHMTNLTPWHAGLPKGVVEHPFITAATLQVLETQGVAPGSIDIIYSQAAAYFETDYPSFLRAACRLLRPGGTLLFNHRSELAGEIDVLVARSGVRRKKRIDLGGMNGSVVCFERDIERLPKTLAAYVPQAKVASAR